MAVHLIKLAVGVDSIEHLSQIQDRRRHENTGVLRHLTRNTPKRSKELIDDGSIYWVIKGFIRVRQKIIGFEEAIGRGGKRRCAICLHPQLIRVCLTPQRPIQGWRYLDPLMSPKDLCGRDLNEEEYFPEKLFNELKSLGLI